MFVWEFKRDFDFGVVGDGSFVVRGGRNGDFKDIKVVFCYVMGIVVLVVEFINDSCLFGIGCLFFVVDVVVVILMDVKCVGVLGWLVKFLLLVVVDYILLNLFRLFLVFLIFLIYFWVLLKCFFNVGLNGLR